MPGGVAEDRPRPRRRSWQERAWLDVLLDFWEMQQALQAAGTVAEITGPLEPLPARPLTTPVAHWVAHGTCDVQRLPTSTVLFSFPLMGTTFRCTLCPEGSGHSVAVEGADYWPLGTLERRARQAEQEQQQERDGI